MLLTFLLALSFGNASKLLQSSSHSSDFGARRRTQSNGRAFAVGDSVLVEGEENACIASIVEDGIVTINYADGVTFGETIEVDLLTLVEAGVGCPEGEPATDTSSADTSSDDAETDGSEEDTAMVKLCLFYASPSGHARTDPIINQECASDHMHTFYGPLHLHPATSYDDLISTPPQFSTSPVEENQSNYWHPSIYRTRRSDGEAASFELVTNLEVGPYYRWDNSVSPATVAYPPGFRMIAHYPSSDPGSANRMMTECCMLTDDDETCEEWPFLHFPARKCDFVGIALAMPSCWDGVELGDQNNHVDHMRYTTNGEVAGPCPSDFPVRLPELQLFVRILNYEGDNFKYQLSSGSVGADSEGNGDNQNWHVDFMNGWKEGTIQTLIDNCPIPEQIGYNPYCECLHTNDGANALPNDITFRPRELAHEPLCEDDVRSVILDEPTHNVAELPRGTCQGASLKERSYTTLSDSLFPCASSAPTDGGESDDVSPAACVDDDELAIATASAQGQTIGGCSDASAWCGVVPEVSEICPVTCGVCSTTETTKPNDEEGEEEANGDEDESADGEEEDENEDEEGELTSGDTILLIGDSWVGPEFEQGTLDANCADKNVNNIAQSGSTAQEWLSGEINIGQAKGEAITSVYLSLGANDVMGRGCRTSVFPVVRQRLNGIIAQIRVDYGSSIPIVMTGYGRGANAGDGCDESVLFGLNAVIESVANENGATFVNVHHLFKNNPRDPFGNPEYFVDAIHLSPAGYDLMWSLPSLQSAFGCGNSGNPSTTTSRPTTTTTTTSNSGNVANPSRARMEELRSIYQRRPNSLRWAAVSSLVDVITQEFPSMEARIARRFQQQQNLLERSFSKKRWKKSKKAFKQAQKIMISQGEL